MHESDPTAVHSMSACPGIIPGHAAQPAACHHRHHAAEEELRRQVADLASFEQHGVVVMGCSHAARLYQRRAHPPDCADANARGLTSYRSRVNRIRMPWLPVSALMWL